MCEHYAERFLWYIWYNIYYIIENITTWFKIEPPQLHCSRVTFQLQDEPPLLQGDPQASIDTLQPSNSSPGSATMLQDDFPGSWKPWRLLVEPPQKGTTNLTFFRKLRTQTLWGVQNLNLRHIYLIGFFIFALFFCEFGFKVWKKY